MALTVNRESRYRGLLGANHVLGDALVFALIGLPHVGYHQVAPVHESYPETPDERLIKMRDVFHSIRAATKITTINFRSPATSSTAP